MFVCIHEEEQIDSLRGQVEQARGQVAYWESQLQHMLGRTREV
jgi:hypothetical protein